MTAVGEAVESVAHLDFTPPCESASAPKHPAQFALRCLACSASALICTDHLVAWRAWVDEFTAGGRVIVCRACRAASFSRAEAVEEVTL